MPLLKATIDRLSTQHELLYLLIKDFTPPELKTELIPGKWTIHENIAHLICYQVNFLDRIKTILSSDIPVFERYVTGDDPAFPICLRMTTEKLLGDLKKTRQILFKLLTSLTNKQLQQTGHHPKNGRMDLQLWTEFFLLHEAHHIYTIFDLTREMACRDKY